MAPGCARAPRRLLPLPRLPLLLPLLLLLLLLQVTTMAKLPSPQHGQLDRAQPCSSGEYWSDGQCCQLCPAGEYVSQACVSPHTRGSCVKCEPGTFTAWANGLPACQPCSTCRERQEVVAECSSTQDCLCRCRRGHFYQQLESYETCTPCSKCPPGSYVLQECSATADTVCSAAAPNTRNGWWLLLLLSATATVILAVTVF